MRRRQAGVSLLELLVVAAMGALVTAGAVRAFSAGVDFQTRVVPERESQLHRQRFEDKLIQLLQSAYMSADDADQTTYFIGGSSSGETDLTDTASADTLIFTILGIPPSASFMNSQEDFEVRNQKFGPQGGACEIQISTSPVGEAGDRSGLFLREQRPSDGDPYQGGFESVLNEEVTSISFEFWNGEAWVGEWNTLTQGSRRLPAAIRVTYARTGESERPRVIIVRIPLSDATPDNPVGVEGGGAAP